MLSRWKSRGNDKTLCDILKREMTIIFGKDVGTRHTKDMLHFPFSDTNRSIWGHIKYQISFPTLSDRWDPAFASRERQAPNGYLTFFGHFLHLVQVTLTKTL